MRKPTTDPTLPNAPPKAWLEFSAEMSEQALLSYEDGEIDLREALRWTAACSKKCPGPHQVFLLGKTAQRALEITPRKLKTRPPPYPKSLQMSVANLVLMFEAEGLPVDQNCVTGNDALEHAVAWVKALDLCKVPAQETVYRWYLERKKQMGASRKPGRPARAS